MSKSLIKKLRKLDQISPDKNWQTSQRDFILSQIDNSDLVNNKENVSRWSNFYFSLPQAQHKEKQKLLKGIFVMHNCK